MTRAEPSGFWSRPGPAEAILEQPLEGAHVVNRIHELLRSTVSLEELGRIVAGILVAPGLLGFSRALIFDFDEREGLYRGRIGLGAADREADRRARRHLSRWLAPPAGPVEVAGPSGSVPDDERPVLAEPGGEPGAGSFWPAVVEAFGASNGLEDRLRRTTLSPEDPLVERVARGRAAVAVERQQLERARLGDALEGLLTAPSLWAGVRTSQGPRLLLAVDKAFGPEPLDALDTLHLNWFVHQLALAIENAELVASLQAANETLRQLDQLKSNFLATISHELRTPLTAMAGFTRLLLHERVGELAEPQKQLLARVLAHADRLTNVLNDLIEITEIDAGSALEVTLAAVDPMEALMEVLPRLEPRRLSKGVEIETQAEEPVPPIRADRRGLSRVFYHLIDNALKFSRDQSRVRIRFEPGPERLAIAIADGGIGIAPDQLKRIFEAFYQVESDLSRSYEGMGVGLKLTKKIIDSTGGRIDVASRLGQGSTFTISYPRV